MKKVKNLSLAFSVFAVVACRAMGINAGDQITFSASHAQLTLSDFQHKESLLSQNIISQRQSTAYPVPVDVDIIGAEHLSEGFFMVNDLARLRVLESFIEEATFRNFVVNRFRSDQRAVCNGNHAPLTPRATKEVLANIDELDLKRQNGAFTMRTRSAGGRQMTRSNPSLAWLVASFCGDLQHVADGNSARDLSADQETW